MNSAALDPETKISGFLKVSAIKGNNFPGVSWPKQAGRYYVTVAVNNEMQKTTASTKNSAPTWIETFFFNACGTSVLHLQVFSERNFVKDDYVGELEENVQSLLASANNGVITRTLGKKDSRGVLRSIHAGIKFEILTVEMLPGGGTSIAESCFGVHVLIPGVEPIDVDIVAIHGLDGHSKHSWTTKTGTLWLRDLLPEKVPHARVLTYGYDAYTRGRKQLTSESIYDLAKDLLSSLALKRQITNTEQRPIIFVAHSLGGIVLKYALINANTAGRHHNSHHKALELSTYGVLFLGTPHQGARGINLALLMLRIQSIYSNTNDAVLKDLGLHSKALQQQLDLYSAISHRYSTKFYYEVYPTKLFAGKSLVLVDQYSATIPGVQNAEIIALKKDHVGIAKFNQDDGDFETVAGHLCLMTRLAPAMIVERWEEHRLYDGM